MSKHTPGPWWAVVGSDHKQPVCYYHGLVAYIADRDHEDRFIAVVTGEHGDESGRTVTAEEWEHNARLIAAAPDLLETLEEIVSYEGGADSALHDEYVMERVHAAIAKAKGKDQ